MTNKIAESNSQQSKCVLSRTNKRIMFYSLMIALPILQFCIFYIYVNFNSIMLAFQKFSAVQDGVGYNAIFVGLENFTKVFNNTFILGGGLQMMAVSVVYFLSNLVIIMPISLLFSFYIVKKYPLSGAFKIILYLPQIISSVVFTLLFKYFLECLTGENNPLTNSMPWFGPQLLTVLLYNVFFSFGANVLLYVGSMSDINDSVIEAANLDGVTVIQEFIHVTLPSIWPTFITFVVMALAGIFTNQMNMYNFFGYGGGNNFDIFGFFIYRRAQSATKLSTEWNYSELSALGIMITIVLVPITLLVRKMLIKFGPSVD